MNFGDTNEFENGGRVPGAQEMIRRAYAQACKVVPAGFTHVSRMLLPYPILCPVLPDQRKLDVDGNEYTTTSAGMVRSEVVPVV